jgi:hypothetical protein
MPGLNILDSSELEITCLNTKFEKLVFRLDFKMKSVIWENYRYVADRGEVLDFSESLISCQQTKYQRNTDLLRIYKVRVKL